MTERRASQTNRDGVISAGTAMVRLDALRKFNDLAAQLGGDADALFAKYQIDPAKLGDRHAVIPYRSLVNIVERAALELDCADFGMRLAALQDRAKAPLGPLEVAMRHSGTLREAYRYCEANNHVFSSGARISIEHQDADEVVFLRFDILIPRMPHPPQAIEHALLLTQASVSRLTARHVHPREIWFTHEPVSSLETYQSYFRAPVRFGQRLNGVMLAQSDFDTAIPDCDPQIYELATNFIAHRYPRAEPDLTTRVRAVVEKLLHSGECTHDAAAAMLGMHTRTLQRRLRAEGESFETIKDAVRKDLALHYLKQSAVPFSRVAEILGYSETSVLSRSCYRWFSASPRQVRGADRMDDAYA